MTATTITRSEIFTMAWASAKSRRAQFASIRASFSDALRRVWGLVKLQAAIAAEGIKPRCPVNQPTAWEQENPYRAAACARGRARWGHYGPGVRTGCW